MEKVNQIKGEKRAIQDRKRKEQERLMNAQNTKTQQNIKYNQMNKKQDQGKKTNKSDNLITVENLEAELNIPQELREIIEDSDDELPLRFNDPSDLMEILSVLEEKNLFLIKRCQDSEQQLEEKKQQEKQIKEEFSRQIGILQANEQTNANRINKVEAERDALKGISEDNESTRLDPQTQDKLSNQVYQLWKAAKGINTRDDDKSGIENYSTLYLIEETENILNKYFEEFSLVQGSKKYQEKFNRTSRQMKQEKKREHREKTILEEEKARKELGELRQKEKASKQVKKIGKPIMKREYAPPVQKVKEKVIKRGPLEEAYFTYLGLEYNDK